MADEMRPRPPAWPETRWTWRQSLAMPVLIAFAMLMGVGAVTVAGDNPVAAVWCVVGVAIFAVTVVSGIVTYVTPLHRDADIQLASGSEPGLVLRYSGVLRLLVILFFGLGFVANAFLVGRQTTAAAVLALIVLVAFARGRIARGELVLTPDGIRQRGLAFRSRVSWESVIEVFGHYSKDKPLVMVFSPDVHSERTTRLTWFDAPMERSIVVDCLQVAIDQYVVYALLAYYFEHPEARHELGTPASLERARQAARAAGRR